MSSTSLNESDTEFEDAVPRGTHPGRPGERQERMRDASTSVPNDEEPVAGEQYYFVYNTTGDDPLSTAVDPDIFRALSHVSSSCTSARSRQEEFRQTLIARDAVCVISGRPSTTCVGAHFLPFHKGDEWMRIVADSRPRGYDPDVENVDTLDLIDDIRNGILLSKDVHTYQDNLQLVILKTPNGIMDCTDVPACHERELDDAVAYPSTTRYTAQWLKGTPAERRVVPNNTDLAFKKHTRAAKPSTLLLEYMYGIAVVKHWGHGHMHMGPEYRPNIRRPAFPASAPMGSTRRFLSLTKRKKTLGTKHGITVIGGGEHGEQQEIELDAEELVLLLWSSNPKAVQRRREALDQQEQEEQFRLSRVEDWRKEVGA
uniref:HNH nuclease domain-containing protein n=1 Tax=Mycena chlorophos TaxID=658473 RepID=A0ABQ0L427_MYCCL|nr:predicted protein [Mycena chlorophos]